MFYIWTREIFRSLYYSWRGEVKGLSPCPCSWVFVGAGRVCLLRLFRTRMMFVTNWFILFLADILAEAFRWFWISKEGRIVADLFRSLSIEILYWICSKILYFEISESFLSEDQQIYPLCSELYLTKTHMTVWDDSYYVHLSINVGNIHNPKHATWSYLAKREQHLKRRIIAHSWTRQFVIQQ